MSWETELKKNKIKNLQLKGNDAFDGSVNRSLFKLRSKSNFQILFSVKSASHYATVKRWLADLWVKQISILGAFPSPIWGDFYFRFFVSPRVDRFYSCLGFTIVGHCCGMKRFPQLCRCFLSQHCHHLKRQTTSFSSMWINNQQKQRHKQQSLNSSPAASHLMPFTFSLIVRWISHTMHHTKIKRREERNELEIRTTNQLRRWKDDHKSQLEFQFRFCRGTASIAKFLSQFHFEFLFGAAIKRSFRRVQSKTTSTSGNEFPLVCVTA